MKIQEYLETHNISFDNLKELYPDEYWKSTRSLLLYPSNITSDKITDFNAFASLHDGHQHHHCGL
jgi:hypothetical protein